MVALQKPSHLGGDSNWLLWHRLAAVNLTFESHLLSSLTIGLARKLEDSVAGVQFHQTLGTSTVTSQIFVLSKLWISKFDHPNFELSALRDPLIRVSVEPAFTPCTLWTVRFFSRATTAPIWRQTFLCYQTPVGELVYSVNSCLDGSRQVRCWWSIKNRTRFRLLLIVYGYRLLSGPTKDSSPKF